MEVPFTLRTEMNVREAFCMYAEELGYSIIESQEAFPDYTLIDEDGTEILTEVEKRASDFEEHGHDPDGCELILCWYDDLGARPDLPDRIALADKLEAEAAFSPQRHRIVEYAGKHSKKGIDLWRDETDTFRLRFRWWGREDSENNWQDKSGGSPDVTVSQFKALLEQIPESVREEAFIDREISALADWYDDPIEQPGQGENIAAIEAGDEKYVLRLKIPSEETQLNLAIDRYTRKGSGWNYASRGSACLSGKQYTGLLSEIPPEVREAVFVNLNVTELHRWHKNQTGCTI
ncbi:hypothetical protein ACFQE1_03180 [Halobium palmae]|uniref:Uncharacterized protein n=1 Tax=Halobium palmae TaxID=1776492 RepID=A0ABD5RXD4_9EURY